MQLSLVQFGTVASGGLSALEKSEDSTPHQLEDGTPEPIEIDLSEGERRTGVQGLFHNAAEFLIISITGCEPKR